MAILPIIVAPDPRLKAKCEPVERVDSGVAALMDDLLETMYLASGIGLAAPQVGVHKCVLVVDISPKDGPREPLCLANPQILAASEELQKHEEGCLSLPKYYADVERPARVSVRYLDRDNQTREIEADGMLAVCLQHEIDHLDGILFVDHVSALKRGMILRKLRKAKKQGLLAAE